MYGPRVGSGQQTEISGLRRVFSLKLSQIGLSNNNCFEIFSRFGCQHKLVLIKRLFHRIFAFLDCFLLLWYTFFLIHGLLRLCFSFVGEKLFLVNKIR